MNDIQAEIERVKTALVKTNSPKMKNDYTKYLKKLQKKAKIYEKENNCFNT